MSKRAHHIQRGDIWIADLNPVRGHEQAGTRPVLIFSANAFNRCGAELVIVIPITSKQKYIPSHVELKTNETGLEQTSYAKCEDIRSISIERLRKGVGNAPLQAMHMIEKNVQILLDL